MAEVETTRDGQNELLTRSYGRIYRQTSRPWGDVANSDLRRLFPSPTGRVLDLGCGPGKNLAHLLQGDASVVAVDVCDEALALARGRFAGEVASGRLVLVHGDEDSVSGTFDLVVCSGVLVDHLAPRRRAIADQIGARLAPGGHALVTVFGRHDPAHGVGPEVEPHTYLHDFGFPVHYFSSGELLELFGSVASVVDHYTRTKHDEFPVPHLHETHVLVARGGQELVATGVSRRLDTVAAAYPGG